MSMDTSVECRSICRPRCRPIYRSMGAQNTHDPINNRFFIVSFFLQANMKKLNWMFMSVILTTLHFVVPGECYRIPTLPDNCTCVTSEGTYSLFPLGIRKENKSR